MIQRRVRIILVSAGFDTQITTTVLWLNDLYGLDITCVRLTPYRVDERLVLDVQQVIPLPEAAELVVRLRQRESAARDAELRSDGRDMTQYVVSGPDGETAPLRKRRAVLALLHSLHAKGVPMSALAQAIPGSRLLVVDGSLEGEALVDAFVDTYPRAEGRVRRWFLEEPLHEDGLTWVLSKMWGTNTAPTLEALLAVAPDGFSVRSVP